MALIEIWPIASGKLVGFILLISLFILTIYYIKGEKKIYIRKVAALDAIEDAIGRSTEMGRPVFLSSMFGGFTQWTMSILSILSFVASICAKVETRLIVPVGAEGAIVRPVIVDIVKNAYRSAGKEEQFDEKDIPFISAEHFARATGYVGMILKEKPGALIMGGEGADSVMFAEEANALGAITITTGNYVSGLAVLACASDYIMIGEEGLAAGAYLSRDPAKLASLRSQDLFKYLWIIVAIIGVLFIQTGNRFIINLLET